MKLAVAAAFAAGLFVTPAAAQTASASKEPDFTLAFRGTTDFWLTASGGLSRGWTTLNKDQLSGTWSARVFGDPGLRIHGQVFRTSGEHLSSHVGDVQTASNIEALSVTRLFEAWAEQAFGEPGKGGLAIRAGLIDLNSDFDSIDPASLFVNSSHGIGPDLSKSGMNGPSIFPVSSVAVRLTWTPSEAWTFRGGLFDGVPGDPNHPSAFADGRIRDGDGLLVISQADYKFSKDGQASVGGWAYTANLPDLSGAKPRRAQGLFGFVEGSVPGLATTKAWARIGLGEPDVQLVQGYIGAGAVTTGPVAGRPDDRLGFAIAHARLSPKLWRRQGLQPSETTFETTYQIKMADSVAIQPDLQYVLHPSGQAGARNALVIGLRLVLTAGFPKGGKATDSADPTVPPDAPAPAEPRNGTNAPVEGDGRSHTEPSQPPVK